MKPPTSPVYLDYNATTPHDPEVVAAMLPFLETHFGNPSSSHRMVRWHEEQSPKPVSRSRNFSAVSRTRYFSPAEERSRITTRFEAPRWPSVHAGGTLSLARSSTQP